MTEPTLPKVFIQPHFIPPERCVELIAQINDAPLCSTTIAGRGTKKVKGKIRRASKAEIADSLLEVIEHRVRELIPSLQEYFGISLAGCQPLQFLQYQSGDFYKVHKDNGNLRIQEVGEAVSPTIANRKLTAVVFLNEQGGSGDKQNFLGGDLVLHSKTSLTDPEDSLLPIPAEAGGLVAFPSSTVHEVIPVVSGIRYSIVVWFD